MEYVYVVASATLGKMGAAIRFATRARLNHISIACRSDLSDLVSFARHFYCTPFCGGFVQEGMERYEKRGHYARVVVYRVPVSPECKQIITQQLDAMSNHSEDYIYHMLAALQTPFHRSTFIPKAYTCLSFAQMILDQTGVLPEKRFYKIEALTAYLAPYQIYDGTIEVFNLQKNPRYFQKMPRLRCWRMSIAQNARLLYRILRRNDEGEAQP